MNFPRVIKFGFLNFWRNPWLSLATTFVFALTLLIISIFFFLILGSQATISAIEEKMDLSVYFKDEAKEEDIFNLKDTLGIFPQVKSVKYISKEEALVIWNNLPTSQRIKQLVTSEKNPLPRSLQVKVSKPDALDNITDFLSAKKYQDIIREGGISYQKNKLIVKRLTNITKFIKRAGGVLSLVFLAISFLVMFNAIRLTILSRKDEIEIQKLVGATNRFIEGPFMVEGILYGLFATIISTSILYGLIRFVSPMVARYLGEVSFNIESYFISNLLLILVIQFVIGALTGIVCSLISVKKYVKI